MLKVNYNINHTVNYKTLVFMNTFIYNIYTGRKKVEELKPNTSPGNEKLRAVMNLQMKAELSQLEDPPVTPWEKELSSGRLQYEFFNIPCEELAQRLLGL